MKNINLILIKYIITLLFFYQFKAKSLIIEPLCAKNCVASENKDRKGTCAFYGSHSVRKKNIGKQAC
jgi:hypothetical protein